MRAKWFLFAAGIVVMATGYAQMVSRPYRNGSVWNISFIRMKPGMDSAYLTYLASDWKRNQEALKQQGVLLSYRVLTTESHGANDFNIMLMTEYRDLATLEANEGKADAISQQLLGGDEKMRQGYKDRGEMREIIGTRLTREIVLEPRKP